MIKHAGKTVAASKLMHKAVIDLSLKILQLSMMSAAQSVHYDLQQKR